MRQEKHLEPEGASPEQWSLVEELFLAAAGLPESEQSAFLLRACGGDEDLRHEVESLLAYDRRSVCSITDALQDTATSLMAQQTFVGERLGAYRITRQIGAGGMATVYLAVRDDDQYQKRVALKLVKSGLVSSAFLERFRHERQILANLDHPYIARLLDGGTTEEGLPYLVMEYVEGVPIDVYCEHHELDVERRCELFRKVCEAVTHAHRNLVIHRDVKPGNLLVTADGTPKLLDFGIAKLLTADGSRTQYGLDGALMWALTPDYASPEQVRGEAVTTASDVYSLGALLYRLLTGVKPHSITTYTPSEVERAVCREEPARPSVATGKAGWRKHLAGDLDNIVLMAMRKEPQRRYGSVEGLSEDIRRHLAGLPVAAREDALGYRAGKFLKRHRMVVAAAALAALSLAGGTAGALWQAHRAGEARLLAERQRERAEAQRRKAEREHEQANRARDRAVTATVHAEANAREAQAARTLAEQRLGQLVELANRSVFDIQGAIGRLTGATEARNQIAKTTADFLDGLARDSGGDVRVLKVLAQAYARLGDVQGLPTQASLGKTGDALEYYLKAHQILQELVKKRPVDRELKARLAELHLRIGKVLTATSRTEEGVGWYERGLAVARALERERPGDPEAVQQAGLFQQALTRSYLQIDLTRAAVFAEAQLESFRKLVALEPASDDAAHGLSAAYSMIGSVAAQMGRMKDAVDYVGKCAEIRERLVARHPNDAELQRDLMLAYGHMGDRMGNPTVPNLGDRRGAKASFEKARTVAQTMVAADPSNQMARRDLATVLMRLGLVTETPDEREESLAALRQSAEIIEEQFKSGARTTQMQQDLAMVHEYTGTRLMEAGSYAEALANYGKSLALAEKLAGADPQLSSAWHQIMVCYKGLALVRARQGDRSGAFEQLRQASETAERLAREGPNARAMQRHPARARSWAGAVYETFAQDSQAPAGQRLEDWKRARDAYAHSQSLWNKVEPGYRSWSRPEIELTERRLKVCEEQVRLGVGPRE